VQHLGQAGLEARALARGEDGDGKTWLRHGLGIVKQGRTEADIFGLGGAQLD
jgi:hypothetical protein